MTSDKIQFRCPKCSKVLAVASHHAGKTVKCPGCQTHLKLPGATQLTSVTARSAPAANSDQAVSSARATSSVANSGKPVARTTPGNGPLEAEVRLSLGMPATGLDPRSSSSIAKSQSNPQSNPFDFPDQPNHTSQAASANYAPANPFVTQATGPTTFSANPQATTPSSASPGTRSGDIRKSTQDGASSVPLGLSIGGFITAVIVASIFMVVWLVVAAVTGRELGVLAWGLGGAIGAVAGFIARNPSKLYCGSAAGLAVVSILMAKVVMAKVVMAMFLMLASLGMDVMQEFANYSPERVKQLHALADEKLANGELDGYEKDYAQRYVKAFYSGQHEVLYEEVDVSEDQYEIQQSFAEDLGQELDALTPQDIEKLVSKAKARHPEWIEDNNHYLAMVDQLANEPGALPDDLLAHARNELAGLDEVQDTDYYESVAPKVMRERRNQLRDVAAQRLVSLDASATDEAVRTALKNHPLWNPFPDASHAMMETMYENGEFQGPLARHAEAAIAATFDDEYSEYYDEVDYDEIDSRDNDVQKLISAKLVDLDATGREQVIAEARLRHPDWYGENMTLEQQQAEMQRAMEEIGGDGSFLGSFAAVCGPLDLLWIFLGASTAYSTSRKLGFAA
ncbi:hypothetical protein Pla22_17070 [Rubripirellula amarantea]|uniref:Uncharacterized protein n=1 Tax=Rubripirellula amarantea TaxID=2527999 RepID=A0A5C5WW46_9BACT|nr:hypothetical protein [Rubripirellula amarantea]TWT54072.1 hypothetical protein Pla22_17070 [Rubripirellula amarantea]